MKCDILMNSRIVYHTVLVVICRHLRVCLLYLLISKSVMIVSFTVSCHPRDEKRMTLISELCREIYAFLSTRVMLRQVTNVTH